MDIYIELQSQMYPNFGYVYLLSLISHNTMPQAYSQAPWKIFHLGVYMIIKPASTEFIFRFCCNSLPPPNKIITIHTLAYKIAGLFFFRMTLLPYFLFLFSFQVLTDDITEDIIKDIIEVVIRTYEIETLAWHDTTKMYIVHMVSWHDERSRHENA